MSANNYLYQPLSNPTETRVLVLEPGEYGDGLVGKLIHVDIEDKPQFEAISYCWSASEADKPTISPDLEVEVNYQTKESGTDFTFAKLKYVEMQDHPSEMVQAMYHQSGGPRKAETMDCDGQSIIVGGELASALKQFRYTDRSRTLWADALCINQNDLDEKAEQVRNMGQIFKRATTVLIWLGGHITNVHQAVETLFKVNEKIGELIEKGMTDLLSVGRIMKQSQDFHWDSLAELLRRAWFTRIWCLQEAVYARQAILRFGEIELPWEFFASTIDWLSMHGIENEFWSRGESLGAPAVSLMGRLQKQEHPPDLDELLRETRAHKSTLSHDKVFAVLGLASGKSTRSITIDYRMNPEELFTNLAASYMKENNSLTLLYDCFKAKPRMRTVMGKDEEIKFKEEEGPVSKLKLPSWVPDWTIPSWHESLHYRGHPARASGTSEPEFTISDGILTVHAIVVDRVARIDLHRPIPWVSLPAEDGNMSHEERERHGRSPDTRGFDGLPVWQSSHLYARCLRQSFLKAWLENCIQIAFPDGEASPEQFENLWRTFLCDSLRDGTRPGPEYGEAFTLFMQASTTMRTEQLDKDWYELGEAFHEASREPVQHDLRGLPGDMSATAKSDEKANRFTIANGHWCYNRRFIRTVRGNFGWVPNGVENGDFIAIVKGLNIPIVLSPLPGAEKVADLKMADWKYEVAGDAYVHGIMDLDWSDGVEWDEIQLV